MLYALTHILLPFFLAFFLYSFSSLGNHSSVLQSWVLSGSSEGLLVQTFIFPFFNLLPFLTLKQCLDLTLYPSSTKIKFSVEEDKVSKRGYIITLKNTMHCERNLMGDSWRERGIQCFKTVLKSSSAAYTGLMLYVWVSTNFGKCEKKKVVKSVVIVWSFGLNILCTEWEKETRWVPFYRKWTFLQKQSNWELCGSKAIWVTHKGLSSVVTEA